MVIESKGDVNQEKRVRRVWDRTESITDSPPTPGWGLVREGEKRLG